MATDTIPVVVPKRSDQISENQTASTDAGSPDLKVKAMNVLTMILVRGGRVYFQSFLGMLTAAGVGAVAVKMGTDGHMEIPVGGWQVFQAAAYLALFPLAYSFIQNAAELFTRLDEKFPKLRA